LSLGRRREELATIPGSLTLLSNVAMAWMTHPMQQVLDQWKQAEGRNIEHDILRHIGLAHFEGINFREKFDFPMHQYQERLLLKVRQRE
jgi:hypothetical protein